MMDEFGRRSNVPQQGCSGHSINYGFSDAHTNLLENWLHLLKQNESTLCEYATVGQRCGSAGSAELIRLTKVTFRFNRIICHGRGLPSSRWMNSAHWPVPKMWFIRVSGWIIYLPTTYMLAVCPCIIRCLCRITCLPIIICAGHVEAHWSGRDIGDGLCPEINATMWFQSLHSIVSAMRLENNVPKSEYADCVHHNFSFDISCDNFVQTNLTCLQHVCRSTTYMHELVSPTNNIWRSSRIVNSSLGHFPGNRICMSTMHVRGPSQRHVTTFGEIIICRG